MEHNCGLVTIRNDNKIPYTEKFSIRQCASRVLNYSSQYGGEEAYAYTAQNLAGDSRIYPKYGDFSYACVFRSFSTWWRQDSLLWSSFDGEFDNNKSPESLKDDFVELFYSTPVELQRVDIYETFNPGHVAAIYAGYCTLENRTADWWTLVWQRESTEQQNGEKASRIFSPQLNVAKLRRRQVNAIRIEICSAGSDYYPELDAVYVVGAPCCDSSPMTSKHYDADIDEDDDGQNDSGSEADLGGPNWRSESAMDNGQLIRRGYSGSVWSLLSFRQAIDELRRLVGFMPTIAKIDQTQLASLSAVPPPSYLSTLPSELVYEIFDKFEASERFLILARLSNCCRVLNSIATNSELYKFVDLKTCWNYASRNYLSAISFFTSRCNRVQKLRLSWLQLPGFGDYEPTGPSPLCSITPALTPGLLTVALFGSCQGITDDFLTTLCESQPNIEVLDLSSCREVRAAGFLAVASLSQLRCLSLYRTFIETNSLIYVAERAKHLEVLNVGSLVRVSQFDLIIPALVEAAPPLRAIDLWRAHGLTSQGLRQLIQVCPNIEELDLGWCPEVRSSSGIFRQISRLSGLRRLLLTANRTICDDDLEAFGTNLVGSLEMLDILGCRDVTKNAVIGLLTSCPHLRFLDLSFCAALDLEEVIRLRETFPNCSIKKSYQT